MDTAGHYRILDRLGSGGMGVVFKAEDTRLHRIVALKVLPKYLAGDRLAVARLAREARTASSLNHPNICTIFDVGEAEGRPFIAMEYLDGDTLNAMIAAGPLDLPRVLDIGAQIADALAAAHARGIVHRDIKPENILVTTRGDVKVLDFGIAHAGRDEAADAPGPAGTTVGTPAYMSPEQALSKYVDPRSDLFSLGLVLYEMSTGRQAFDGSTPAAVYDGILNRQPRPPRDLIPELPQEFDAIVARALEKDPALRYQTASELRADLQRLGRTVEARPREHG